MDIGLNIKTLRNVNNNLPQRKLAEYLGVSSNTISNYEQSFSKPDLYKIKKIANFFGISTDLLLTDNHKNIEHFFEDSKTTQDNRSDSKFMQLRFLPDDGTRNIFKVSDNSMSPSFNKEDYVICKKINDWKSIETKHFFILKIKKKSPFLRRIFYNIPHKILILLPENPEFSSISIPVSNVNEIWQVEYCIKSF